MKTRIFSFFLYFCLLLSVGCSSLSMRSAPEGKNSQLTPTEGRLSTQLREFQIMPWEIWDAGRDFSSNPVQNLSLVQGDQFFSSGNRENARVFYERAFKSSIGSPAIEELALYRLASLELSEGNSEGALQRLSEFYRVRGMKTETVGGPHSLLFGYAYGSSEQFDQSLAWFSRAAGQSLQGNQKIYKDAKNATTLLLRSLSDRDLEEVRQTWSSDSFISTAIIQEFSSRPGRIQGVDSKNPFWSDSIRTVRIRTREEGSYGEEASLAVLLPLSGRYRSLGQSVRNGIELAFTRDGLKSPYSLHFRDTGGNTLRGAEIAEEYIQSGSTKLFVGPLLSAPAIEVARKVRDSGIPGIMLSKQEGFETGQGVFRFGPTVESQVSSLVRVAVDTLGFRRFAIVAPQNSRAEGFLKQFQVQLQSMGISSMIERRYMPGDFKSFIPISEELEQLKPEVIFLPDSLTAASSFMLSLTPKFRKEIRLMGPASWDNPTELTNSRTVLEGITFVSPFFIRGEEEFGHAFVDSFEQRFGARPNFLAAQGFDLGVMIQAALDRSSLGQESLVDSIQNIQQYKGLTGLVSVRKNGEFDRLFHVVELGRNGVREIQKPTSVIYTGDGYGPVYTGGH